MEGKSVVISAPSGAGKTSIVNFLLSKISSLRFSISACSREKRLDEIHGKNYYFFDAPSFKSKISKGDFLEWEEVYPDQYYGTLNSELERIWGEKKHVIFDIDVAGGINVKNKFHSNCISIFIMPPSVGVLEERLSNRGSETKSSINKRITKAELEISKRGDFDHIVLNDDFATACEEVLILVIKFLQ